MNQNVKLDKGKETLTTEIHGLSHDGRGIALIQNKTTFVSNALPNEKVVYQITQKHGQFNEAKTINVIDSSSARTTPPCKHFGLCGGCSLQHMRVETQIELKQKTLLDQLKHFGQVVPDECLLPLSSESIGYRRKARLGVKFVIKKNKLLIGFREKSSNYLAELERCVVLHPSVGENFKAISQLIASLQAYRSIPQIEIAIGDQTKALVFRHLENLSSDDLIKLSEFGKTYQFDIYLQPNSPLLVTKLYPENNYQRLCYTLPDYQLEFLFHPLDFTQINLEMNRLMVKQAITLLNIQPHETVLDLFCGIGNFTLPIARYAHLAVGIEGSEDMVLRATENAKHNKIDNAKFFSANLQKVFNSPWIQDYSYDKILLDPPRAGAKELLPLFATFAAKKIVYVSCNPATLARDAGELVHQYGYRLIKAGVMNMFPHTSHIEAMAVFEK